MIRCKNIKLFLPPLLLLVVLTGCDFEYDALPFLDVETGPVVETSATSVTINGRIAGEFNAAIVEETGFCWSEENELPEPADTCIAVSFNDDLRSFNLSLSDLSPGKKYFIRAFARVLVNGEMRTSYGQSRVIQLDGVSLVFEDELTIMSNEVTLVAQAFGVDQSLPLLAYGFCWSQNNSPPSVQDDTTNLGVLDQSDLFFSRLTGLENGVYYQARPYGIYQLNNEVAIVYGDPRAIRLDDLWAEKSFSLNRRHHVGGFVIGKQAYLTSGIEVPAVEDTIFYDDLMQYDPALEESGEAWKRLNPRITGTPRYAGVAFAVGEKGYVGLGIGNQGQVLSDFHEIEFMPGNAVGRRSTDFPGARFGAVTMVIDGVAYIGMGFDAQGNPLQDFWAFRPGEDPMWTPVENNSVLARGFATAFVIGDKGYLCVGTSAFTDGNDFGDMYEFDPANSANPWRRLNDFPGSKRAFAAGFAIGDKGYLGTGFSRSLNALRDFWEYNPATDSWKERADVLGNFRVAGVGLSLNGKGYIGLGSSSVFGPVAEFADWWAYIPEL